MREIVKALKMEKFSLYDYFAFKDEIVVFVVEEPVLIITKRGILISKNFYSLKFNWGFIFA